MPITGTKPGIGEYTCADCGQEVCLDDHTDRLPPCPKCHCAEYKGVKKMAKKPKSPIGGEHVIPFTWLEDQNIHGWIDWDNLTVFDLVDDTPGPNKGKKIGHLKDKYKKLGEYIKRIHIREKDKKDK